MPKVNPVSDAHPPAEEIETEQKAAKKLSSRRKFLGAVGVGAAALGTPAIASAAVRPRRDGRGGRNGGDGGQNGPAPAPPTPTPSPTPTPPPTPDLGEPPAGPDRFIRMFDDHPPFQRADDDLRRMLQELGAPGGLMDAKDPMEVGPIRLITEPELSPNNLDNPFHTAGTTFVGQFLDHDITSDAGSSLGTSTSLRRSANLRSARFDLDSVYGGGPSETRDLYTQDDPYVFRVESGGLFEDLPRDVEGKAIIADPRNDENMIISGIQVAFLKFHNAVMERERVSSPDDRTAFEDARRQVQWHYQWLIMHQFLPQFVGQAMVDDIMANGRQFYTPRRARIPVEFQTSAYRFGHSLIRPSYRANLAGDNGDAFFAPVFDPTEFGKPDPNDLAGGWRAPRRFIGWQTFFDFGDGEVKPNKRVDTSISTPLFELPMGSIATVRGEDIGPLSLATRNLLRHITWGIPSGQDVAATMGAPRLSAGDLADIGTVAPPLVDNTPLWLYILREADVFADGLHLGPVGGRIVAEVFIGLLQMDSASYLSADPTWRPTLPASTGEFRMVDMLTLAGVDPTTRGQ